MADPVVIETMEALERKYIEDWKGSKPEDAPKRERAYNSLQMLEDFKVQLSISLSDGRMASRLMEQKA